MKDIINKEIKRQLLKKPSRKNVVLMTGVALLAIAGFVCIKSSSKDFVNQMNPQNVKIALNWKIEKPFNLQVFYTTDISGTMNEKQSVHVAVTPENENVELELPVTDIKRFRIDFGSEPGNIILNDVKVIGQTSQTYNDWNHYRFNQLTQETNEENATLKLFSDGKDPYITYKNLIELNEVTE